MVRHSPSVARCLCSGSGRTAGIAQTAPAVNFPAGAGALERAEIRPRFHPQQNARGAGWDHACPTPSAKTRDACRRPLSVPVLVRRFVEGSPNPLRTCNEGCRPPRGAWIRRTGPSARRGPAVAPFLSQRDPRPHWRSRLQDLPPRRRRAPRRHPRAVVRRLRALGRATRPARAPARRHRLCPPHLRRSRSQGPLRRRLAGARSRAVPPRHLRPSRRPHARAGGGAARRPVRPDADARRGRGRFTAGRVVAHVRCNFGARRGVLRSA